MVGLALLVGLVLLAYWFVSADPRKVIQVLKWTVIILGGGFLLYVLVRAHYGLLIALLPILLMFLLRQNALKHRMKAARGPTKGQISELNSHSVSPPMPTRLHSGGSPNRYVLKNSS